jgi:DNA mismatch endonuclease Vsr
MKAIRSKDTKPELRVRSLLHRMGYRFRVSPKDLPGKPDIAFPGRKMAIFVNGCFWHRHAGCRFAYRPKSRQEFWDAKFARTVIRDNEVITALAAIGWSTLVVWECETSDDFSLERRLTNFLGSARLAEGKPHG